MARKSTTNTEAVEQVVMNIDPPKFVTGTFRIVGTTPYCQARFSAKAIEQLKKQHEEGQRARKGKTREARNFEEDYRNAMHISEEGWPGIPASAFRNALISACRLVGFKMTIAKLSIFVQADGLDAVDGTPLVRIEGEPEMTIMPVRNANKVIDLRARPLWRQWSANVTLKWDADQFSERDILNLLWRAGTQVGIGEGRPDSRESTGMGWGTFTPEQVLIEGDANTLLIGSSTPLGLDSEIAEELVLISDDRSK